MASLIKLWQLLTKDQQRASVVLLALMLIGMVLETAGIGLVIPALALMTQGDIATRYPALVPWLNLFGNPSNRQLVIYGMTTLVSVYFVKTLFLAFLTWRQSKFVFGLMASFSQRLFAGYLRQPYTFHLQRNSALLIRNVTVEVGFITNVLQQYLILIAEILVLLGISALLIGIEPIGALFVSIIIGLAGWSFHRVTQGRILQWGKVRQNHDGMRMQHLQQGLGAAKDVKLLGREEDFITQFQIHNDGSARVYSHQTTMLQLPRLWLELLAIVGLAALVLVMIWQGKQLEALLPALGLFAAAAFRLMPSVNRVISAVQNVRFALPVVDILHSELCQVNMTDVSCRTKLLPFNEALTIEGVSFRYSSSEDFALHNVNLSIARGVSVGFIGGSGAGKSTLVDIILGLLAPNDGTVMVDGVNIQTNLRGWQDLIGYVPQSIYLTDDTLRRNVAFGLPNERIDEAAVIQAMRAAQLDEFIKELPKGLDTMVGERGVRLSGGQIQRIGIARALYHDPPVLVLDEATSSLDTVNENGVMEAVRALQGNKTILIVAHRLSTVKHCERLFRLEKGRVVEEGETAAVLGEKISNKDG